MLTDNQKSAIVELIKFSVSETDQPKILRTKIFDIAREFEDDNNFYKELIDISKLSKKSDEKKPNQIIKPKESLFNKGNKEMPEDVTEPDDLDENEYDY